MPNFKHTDIYRNARFAGQVSRYHTWPVQRDQSVGEHTWQLLRIYCQIFGPPSPSVTLAIVWHDGGELVAGDPPGMVKQLCPEIKPLLDSIEQRAVVEMGGPAPVVVNPVEKLRIKVCDLIDVYEFGCVEVLQGNRLAEPIAAWGYDNAMARTRELPLDDRDAVCTYLSDVRRKFQR